MSTLFASQMAWTASAGVSGLSAYARLHARGAGPVAQRGGVLVDLDVEGEHVRPRVLEGLDVVPGVGHHEVAVEERVGVLGEALDHGRAEGEVRDEVPVHDVEVEPVRAAVDDLLGLVRHAGEVGGEEGRVIRSPRAPWSRRAARTVKVRGSPLADSWALYFKPNSNFWRSQHAGTDAHVRRRVETGGEAP
jgi:hypothetical protein